jgi:DNA-damage-inducible protein J
MARTSNVFARIEPELKEQAEAVLTQLGIPMSNAISLFLRQVVLQRGIPFDIKLPPQKPLVLGSLTEEQLDTELEKGYTDYLSGKTIPAERIAEKMRRDYGI